MEHSFRHEFGRLSAVLTRSLGVRRLDVVDDVAPSRARAGSGTWSRRGVPKYPAGWLYRTARNGQGWFFALGSFNAGPAPLEVSTSSVLL